MRIKTFLTVGVILLISSVFAFASFDLKFTAEGITHSPVPVIAGNNVTYTVGFKAAASTWTFEAVANCKVIGGVDGETILVETYPTFMTNNTLTATFNWTATTGSHKVWFVIDPNHKTKDVRYDNNRIEETFSVGPAPSIGVQDDTPQVSVGRTRKAVPITRPQVLAPADNPSGIGDNPDQNLLKKWIKVTDPHSGDYWDSGTNYTIKWETNITQGNFMIELYNQYGKTKVQYIGKSSSTSYLWKVALKPTLNSGLYRIRISYSVRGSAGERAEGFSEPFYISGPASQSK